MSKSRGLLLDLQNQNLTSTKTFAVVGHRDFSSLPALVTRRAYLIIIYRLDRFVNLRILVHRGDKPNQTAAGVLFDGHPVCWVRHNVRMVFGHVLPLEHPVRGVMHLKRDRFRDGAVRAGVADVAQSSGSGRGGRPRGQMVRPKGR